VHSDSLKLVTARDRPDLVPDMKAAGAEPWPEFMLQDEVVGQYWDDLYRLFPDYQFALLRDDRVVASGNSIPVYWPGMPDELPQEGIEWALRNGVEGAVADRSPSHLCALQIVTGAETRGQGKSGDMVQAMQRIGLDHGLDRLIAPVRPNRKSEYPLEPMEQYITRRNADGERFDPWMRIHDRLGARTLGVCSRSMIIRGTVREWETWTGMRFARSGSYVIPGALTSVEFDLDTDRGMYVEPNVWMIHG